MIHTYGISGMTYQGFLKSDSAHMLLCLSKINESASRLECRWSSYVEINLMRPFPKGKKEGWIKALVL